MSLYYIALLEPTIFLQCHLIGIAKIWYQLLAAGTNIQADDVQQSSGHATEDTCD